MRNSILEPQSWAEPLGENYKVRWVRASDLAAIQKIEKDSFSTPWPLQAFLAEHELNPISLRLVITKDQEICGYLFGWWVKPELQINNITIAAVHRRQGLASKLLHYLMGRLKAAGGTRITLEARPSNQAAMSLYRSLGFELDGSRPNYYSNPVEDALLMSLTLNGDS